MDVLTIAYIPVNAWKQKIFMALIYCITMYASAMHRQHLYAAIELSNVDWPM